MTPVQGGRIHKSLGNFLEVLLQNPQNFPEVAIRLFSLSLSEMFVMLKGGPSKPRHVPDPPILAISGKKKARNPWKKQGFSSPPTSWNPWKRRGKHTK